MAKTIYRSKIDWWVWLVTASFLAIIWLSRYGRNVASASFDKFHGSLGVEKLRSA